MGFDELYQAYFKDVFLYMKSFSVDDHTAEEITQETFVKALRSISQFDGRKDTRAWLFTIARNTWFTWSKREKRLIQCPDALQAESIPDPSPDVTEKNVNEEMALLIHIFLHNMKEPYKEVFSLRIFGELPFSQIGELFGKTESWARVTYHRARLKIKEEMQ